MPEPMLRFNPNRPGFNPQPTIDPTLAQAAAAGIPPAVSLPRPDNTGLARGIASAGASIGDAFEKMGRKKEERRERKREAYVTSLGSKLTEINSVIEGKRKLLQGVHSIIASVPEWLADPRFEPLIRSVGVHGTQLEEVNFNAQNEVLDSLIQYEKTRDFSILADTNAKIKNRLKAIRNDPEASWNITDNEGRTNPEKFLAASSAMALTDLSYHTLKMAAEHGLDAKRVTQLAEEMGQRKLLRDQGNEAVFYQTAGAQGGNLDAAVSRLVPQISAFVDMAKTKPVSRSPWDILEEGLTRAGEETGMARVHVRHLREVLSEERMRTAREPIATHDPVLMGVHTYLSHLLIPALNKTLAAAKGLAGGEESVAVRATTGEILEAPLPPDLVALGKSLKGKQVEELQEILAALTKVDAVLDASDSVQNSLVVSFLAREKNPLYKVDSLLRDLKTTPLTSDLLTEAFQQTVREDPDLAYIGKFMADLPLLRGLSEPLNIGTDEQMTEELVGPQMTHRMAGPQPNMMGPPEGSQPNVPGPPEGLSMRGR